MKISLVNGKSKKEDINLSKAIFGNDFNQDLVLLQVDVIADLRRVKYVESSLGGKNSTCLLYTSPSPRD